jgi:hypothetical protein
MVAETRHDRNMSSKDFYTALRWLSYPLFVVVALNIESAATKAGYDSVLSQFVADGSVMREIADTLTSPLASYVAVFLLGGSILAWFGLYLERHEGQGRGPSLYFIALHCEALADYLKSKKEKYWLEGKNHPLHKANTMLRGIGFTEVPPEVMSDPALANAYRVYLQVAVHHLRNKEVDLAKRLSTYALNHELESIVLPQSPTNIGPEIPL